MRLTKGMFGTEFGRRTENPFKLQTGQMRHFDFVHNGGWYNAAGEKLGWGDLEPKDFSNIRFHMEEKDIFVVLPESSSYWDFVTKVHPLCIGGMNETKGVTMDGGTIEAPGTEFVAEHAMYIITKAKLYVVAQPYIDLPKPPMVVEVIAFDWISKEEAGKIIKEAANA